MATETIFDAASTDLRGRLVIEASAGTGKTWSLSRIVMRLVAEEGFPIGSILLVTFTKAATEELKSRVKELLAEASDALAGLDDWPDNDASDLAPFMKRWKAAGLTVSDCAKRLTAAVDNFDDASVYTIHGFCREMLDKCLFSQGGQFDCEFGADDELRAQVVDEFMRRELLNPDFDPAFKTRILEKSDFDAVLKTVVTLSRRSKRTQWELLDAERSQCSPEEEALLRRFIDWAPARLAELKHRAGIRTFDDLLVDMDSALTDPDFARAVRSRFNAVLIDEFQDTDPLQYAVFKTLFMSGTGDPASLVFVGDPKQSIYAFRNADLQTYQQAVKDIGRTLRLATNFRSSQALVAGVNAFFSGNQSDGEDDRRRTFLTDTIAYSRVGAAGRAEPLMRDGKEVPVFEVWTMAKDNVYPDTGSADGAEAAFIAEDIARLLDGKTTLKGKSLKPRDIALLVSKKTDADATVAALAERGIRVLKTGEDTDVFQTEAASEVLSVLKALEMPQNRALFAAAQATKLFGRTLKVIREGFDERIADTLLMKTMTERWEKGALAAAFAHLFTERNVENRLLPQAGGERYLSDARQVVELLHKESRRYRTLSGLVRRFETLKSRTMSEDNTDRKCRVESDEDLVIVQTIHSSKGLEYPVVYLPGAAKMQISSSGNTDGYAVFRVRGPSGSVRLFSPCRVSRSTVKECFADEQEEGVRKAYVALTRASSRVVLPQIYCQSKGKINHYRTNNLYLRALAGLTRCPEEATKGAFNEKACDLLAELEHRFEDEAGPLCRVVTKTKGEAENLTLPAEITKEAAGVMTADKSAAYPLTSRVSSFTSIVRRSLTPARMPVLACEETPVFDAADDVIDFDADTQEAPQAGLALFNACTMRGPDVGTFLHEIMQRADFTDDTNRARLIDAMIRKYAYLFPEENREEAQTQWAAYIERMMKAVLSAHLTDGDAPLKLSDVPFAARYSEWPFTMSVARGAGGKKAPRAKTLAALLKAFGPEYAIDERDDTALTGYLTGTADLVFKAQGKYWLVDWKSNFIGSGTPADYTEKAVHDEMRRHNYRLQYLIYLTAMKRFLEIKTGVADGCDLIGGVFYVFLRGAGEGSPTQGIFRDRPPAELIRALDTFFKTGERPVKEARK